MMKKQKQLDAAAARVPLDKAYTGGSKGQCQSLSKTLPEYFTDFASW